VASYSQIVAYCELSDVLPKVFIFAKDIKINHQNIFLHSEKQNNWHTKMGQKFRLTPERIVGKSDLRRAISKIKPDDASIVTNKQAKKSHWVGCISFFMFFCIETLYLLNTLFSFKSVRTGANDQIQFNLWEIKI